MEPENNDQPDIQDGIPCSTEKIHNHIIEIVVVSHHIWPLWGFCESKLHKVKVNKMYHQEDKNDNGCVNHILTEKGSVREPLYLIPFRPGHPILDLQDQPKYDVDEKSAKQDNLKYLDKGIAGHEMNCNLENFHMISRYW
jgi:hypothetical protein